MYWLQNVSGILKSDCNAHGLYGKCRKLKKADLRVGDFVFKINSTGRATHIGYVADTDINVIEALGRDYGGSAGVEDAAAEVRALQRKGLRVSAVFMGEDASAADASRIYGKNMARIRGMDQLARAAGRLIQNEIRELGD